MLCYYFLQLKKIKIKYVIYETYNIIYNILKCYKTYLNYLNVIVINLHTWYLVSYFIKCYFE
jgi:hypothetical protein